MMEALIYFGPFVAILAGCILGLIGVARLRRKRLEVCEPYEEE
jgi:hypothetical protein